MRKELTMVPMTMVIVVVATTMMTINYYHTFPVYGTEMRDNTKEEKSKRGT